MNDQTQAASSPAEVDVFRGEQPSLDEYNRYRQSGELPARFKPAEAAASAPADAPEETADAPESAPDSEPDETQEQPPKSTPAQKRILQLLARVKELERSQQPAKPDAQPGSSPAQAQQPTLPQNAQAEPTPEDRNSDGTAKFETYEKYVKALARWEVEQELAQRQKQWAAQAQAQELTAKVADAQARYGDAFEASRDAFTKATLGPNGEPLIPVGVLAMVSDSDMLADVVHALGSDPEELAKFIKTARANPRQAILQIAQVEGTIREERANPDSEGTKGGKAPESKKTQAPKPPSPVSGGSSRAFDVSDESLSPEEWMRKRNKQVGKG